MKLLLLCLLLAAAVSAASASEPNAVRDKVLHNTTIQGFPCARGAAWFYPDGSLNQCTLAQPAALGDLRVPRGSVVELWPNGEAHYLTLPRATVLAGYRVRGADRLSLSRGATTAFYRTGELHSLYLTGNQAVHGIPCHGGAWNTFTDPAGNQNVVEFYPDGSLESCQLSRDFSGFRTGQRIVLPHPASPADSANTHPAQ